MKHPVKKTAARLTAALLAVMAALPAAASPLPSSVPTTASERETDITVLADDVPVSFPDQQPVIRDNRTLVPLRFIAESLGCTVDWDAEERSVSLDRGRIVLYPGTRQAVLDGIPTELDVQPAIIGNRTMVPLRVVAETLGCTVDWFEDNHTVLISPRQTDGQERSVFERLWQSGLFWSYETDTAVYLVRKDRYRTRTEAADPSNEDLWWVEQPKHPEELASPALDCTIVLRSFDPETCGQVQRLFYMLYPTHAGDVTDLMEQTLRGELWQTFYPETSPWYPLYAAMPASSGTFGMYYYDNRQVEMYCSSTAAQMTIQICTEGWENPEMPRLPDAEETAFYTEQAQHVYLPGFREPR